VKIYLGTAQQKGTRVKRKNTLIARVEKPP
jgi:hypothetical protein